MINNKYIMSPDYRFVKNIIIELKSGFILKKEIDSIAGYFPEYYWNTDELNKKHVIRSIYNKQYSKKIYDGIDKWKSVYYKNKNLSLIPEEIRSIEDIKSIYIELEILYLYE